MTDQYPPHLERHRRIYERHENGETYVAIARELGITSVRVRNLALRWKQELGRMEAKRNRTYKFKVPKPNN